jgi:hypothetical protein
MYIYIIEEGKKKEKGATLDGYNFKIISKLSRISGGDAKIVYISL